MFPECEQSTSSCEIKLRELEIDSYSKILSVFRARGNLTNERRKLLKQIGSFLNISQERHRAEVRRVTNDKLLSTIASRLTGQDWTVDWHEEGKRLIPTPTPFSHYTVNTPFADYIASVASLGKKYVDLYNKRICDSVPNEEKSCELKVSCGNSKQQWLSDVSQVFTIVQKDKLRDVSVQTLKKKPVSKKCMYCERRKELRKKRLEEKEAKKNDDSSSENENKKVDQSEKNIFLPSGKHIIVENAFHDLTGDLSVSVIAQEVIVETEPTAGPSRSCDFESLGSFPAIPPVSFTLATPDFSGLNVDPSNLRSKDYLDPTSMHNIFSNVWEDLEKPSPPRIPRILNSGPRKKVRKQTLNSASVKFSSQGDRGLRKKGIEISKDFFPEDNPPKPIGASQVQIKYPKPTQISLPSRQGTTKHHVAGSIRHNETIVKPTDTHSKTRQTETYSKQVGVLRHHDNLPKHHEEVTKTREVLPKHREIISKQHEVLLKHHEGLSKYPEVVPKHIDSSSKPSGGIYKHYVRVRHTPKASKPLSEIPKLHSEIQSSAQNFGETVEIPIEYLHTERSETLNSPLEVVEVSDYRVSSSELSHDLSESQREQETVSVENIDHIFHDNTCNQHISSINFFTNEHSDNLVEEILVPTAEASSHNSEVRKNAQNDDIHPRKFIKIYNGEKKVHRTIHFRAENMKDLMNKLPNAQFSQVEVNNGCQPDEESTTILQSHTVWDGANISGSEFIMEDVSIVDESSYPIVNGHEEIILEEEVFSGSQIMESLVDKSDVCVIPQTDMKFSVVNLNDFTGSIESIHSVSSQSKDDSRDSDIVMNRP